MLPNHTTNKSSNFSHVAIYSFIPSIFVPFYEKARYKSSQGIVGLQVGQSFLSKHEDQGMALKQHGLLLITGERQRKKRLRLLSGSLKKQRLTGSESV